jgi:hypothetical protein
MRIEIRNILPFCFLLFFVLSSLFQSAVATGAVDAKKIAEGVYSQDTSKDASWRATMDVFDKKGSVRQKKFLFRRVGSFGNSKTLVRFTDPAETRGVGLLSYNHKGDKERQWLFTPEIQRTRRIAPQERSRRFLGTDFTHEDMEERVLDDFEYKMLNENETIDGRKAYKIEATPISADRSQYKYLYLWIPHDIPYTVLGEFYDKSDKKIRIYHASDLQKIAGIWVAKRVEMTSPVDNTKTALVIEDIKFNSSLKEDLFTLQALEKSDLF